MENFSPKPKDPKTPEKKVYKAGVVDVSALAKAQARDVADARMTESKEDRSANWFVKNAKRFWKHNVAQEWYRNREIERVKKEIAETSNLYAGESKDVSIKDYDKAKIAIVERFTSEYEDEMLKKEEKESKNSVTDENAKKAIKDLIKQFAGDPNMSEAAFTEAQNRILAASNPEYAQKGKMYASNLVEIAKEVRNAVTHGEKLVEMDFDVEITLGQARESLNTEAKHNTFEKIIEKTQNSKLGKYLFNEPASVAIAAGLYSAVNFLGVKVLRSKLSKWGTFGATALLAGGISAAKEAARLERERAQHMRESAKGMEFKEDDMKRREQMGENKYETKNAGEIITNLEKDLAKVSSGKLKEADLYAVLVNLSDLEARIARGDKEKIDLIAYSKFNKVEEERMKLDLLRAKMKVEIRKGITEGRIEFKKGGTFDNHLSSITNIQTENFSSDIEQKNKIFKTMKRKKVAWAFAKTALIGATAGFIFQEGRALFDDKLDGVFEGVVKHMKGDQEHMGKMTTAIEHLRRLITGDEPRMPFGVGHEVMVGDTHMYLPDGSNLVANPDGTFDILRGTDVIGDNLKLEFEANGDLTAASKDLLAENNIFSGFAQTGSTITKTITQSPIDWINDHLKDGMQKIHHTAFMDNNTPMYPDPDHPGHLLGADHNELKLEWGGDNGIDADGNYVFNVNHMTDDGSFHEGLSVAAKEQLKKGGLEIMLYVSKGTQSMAIPVQIDEFGKAIIDHTSEAGKMLFHTDTNGKAVFDGAFAEVVKLGNLTPDGTQNIEALATHIGLDDAKDITKTIIEDTTQPNVALGLPDSDDYEVPVFIPIPTPRRPLERGEYGKGKGEKFSYFDRSSYLSKVGTKEDQEIWDKNMSPRLKNNPDAKLSQKEELEWYFKKQVKERGAGYVTELDSFIENSPVLKNLSKETKIVVTMPVAAAHESENIYNTLSLYAQQNEESLKQAVILMNLNWKEDADMTKVAKTMSEIERAKVDFPQLKIASFEKVWSKKFVEDRDEKLYGEVVKYLNDTAIRAINRNKLEEDMYLLTNDADAKGLSKNYLELMLNGTKTKPDKDGFLGKIEWYPESYKKYPGFHLSMRVYQIIETVCRARTGPYKSVASSGANFLVKASTFAAVGGYRAEMGAGPDTDLGKKIRYARQGDKSSISDDKFPIDYNNGAWVDTDPSRGLDYYQNGFPIVEQWNDFDKKGYKPRGELKLGKDDGEDIEKDFDKIIERTAFQTNETIAHLLKDGDVETYTIALNYAFPPQGKLGAKKPLWKIEILNGKKVFQFTQTGKDWIYKQLKNYTKEDLAKRIYKRGVSATTKEKISTKTTKEKVTESSLVEEEKTSTPEKIEEEPEEAPVVKEEVVTDRERENKLLAKEFIQKLKMNPELMSKYKKGVEKYEAVKNYKTLDPNSKKRTEVDSDYAKYLQIPKNKDKDIDTFLKDAMSVMNAEFARSLELMKVNERHPDVESGRGEEIPKGGFMAETKEKKSNKKIVKEVADILGLEPDGITVVNEKGEKVTKLKTKKISGK